MAQRGHPPTQFKPGQSGNPKGRPRIRDNLRDVKLLSKTDMRRLMQKILDMTPEEIAELAHDKTVPALEMTMASIIHKALSSGDQAKLSFFLDRLQGRAASEDVATEVQDVTYIAEVQGDGTLLQKIQEEEDKNGE